MIYAVGPPGHGEVKLIRGSTSQVAAELARVAYPDWADKRLDVVELKGVKVRTSEPPRPLAAIDNDCRVA